MLQTICILIILNSLTTLATSEKKATVLAILHFLSLAFVLLAWPKV